MFDEVVFDDIKTATSNNLLIGDVLSVTLRGFDAFDNAAVLDDGTIGITASGSATPSLSTLTLSSGVVTTDISNTVAEVVTIGVQITDGRTADVSATFDVEFFEDRNYVILDPTDSEVDSLVVVTVEVINRAGDRVQDEDRDVTLAVSGSGTGGGVIAISLGRGIGSVTSTVAETIQLSLVDSEGTGLSVASSQDLEFFAGVYDLCPCDLTAV